MFGLMGVARLSGQPNAFSLLSLFRNGEQGAIYEPWDFSTLFQDSAGTTPVTAVEQPVGLILDKRLGLVLGSELVTNGDFSNGTTGWYIAPDWSLVGGALVATGAAAACFPLAGSSVVGVTYLVTIDVSVGSLNVFLGGQYAPQAAPGTFTARFTATNTNGISFSTSAGATIDNISVREIAGNHATQPTAAARPVVSARVNLLRKTEDLDVADWDTPGNVTVETAIYTAPDSSVSGIRITALGFNSGINCGFTGPAARHTGSFFVRAGSASALRFGLNDGGWLAATATIVSGSGSITGSDLFSLSGLDSNWTEVRLVTDANIPASAPRLYFYPGPDTQANGDSVGVWHPQVETGTTATTYQRVTTASDYDTVGFPHYLAFDGIDDCLTTAAIDFTASDKMTVFAGVGKLNADDYHCLLEHGTNSAANAGTWGIWAPWADASGYGVICRGDTGTCEYQPVTFNAPSTNVVAASFDLSGATLADVVNARVDGTRYTTNGLGTVTGGGNFSSQPVYIGSRAGSSFYFTGNLYATVIRGAESSATEIENTEAYIARKAGVTL